MSWGELVKLYNQIGSSNFDLSEMLFVRKRFNDITRAVQKTNKLSHLKTICDKYHSEVIRLGEELTRVANAYRLYKIRKELKPILLTYHKLHPTERVRLYERYRYLISRSLINKDTSTKILLDRFLSNIESKKYHLLTSPGKKRLIIDHKTTVVLTDDGVDRVETSFILPILQVLGITKKIHISEVPVVLDIKRGRTRLKIEYSEKVINRGKLIIDKKTFYVPLIDKKK